LYSKVKNYFLASLFIVTVFFRLNILVSLCSINSSSFLSLSKDGVFDLTVGSIEMTEKASHVVVGRVENIESVWNEETGSIYTYVKVWVEECLKGIVQDDYVVIKHKGGETEDVGLWVSSEPNFSLGEKVKVFLKLVEETGEFTLIDGRKGKISLIAPVSSGFNYSGVHWDQNDLPITYYINEDGTSDVAGTEEFQEVQECFQAWEDDSASSIDYTYRGTTTRSNESLDGYNVVSWQPIDGPGQTLAQTAYWYNPLTQLMIEFDIIFDEDETWSTSGEPDKHDIQNVGTHEVGHTLVLEDLYDPADSEQTMYGYSFLGETKKRTLEEGDLEGLRYIYPSSNPVYTITTSPSGLQIEVDGKNYTSPQSFEWTPNSTHTINVESTQSGGIYTRYVFTGWSDGGAQQHQITTGTASVTIIASYLTQHFVTLETEGLKLAYPAVVNFTQLGVSMTSSTSSSWSGWCDAGSSLTISQLVLGEEGQRWIARNSTFWTVNSALTATISYVLQYQVSITFTTYDQAVTLHPTQIQSLGSSPNNTLVMLESYTRIWLDNVTWTLKQVLWQNSNIVSMNTSSVNLKPNFEWAIDCRVYPIVFDVAFKDYKGSKLSENPSFFVLQFPNGTVSKQLKPTDTYYIQNGTTQWKSITWQSVEVVPPNVFFDATYGNPVVNCRIYDFVVQVSDLFGLPVPGAHVSVGLCNGRIVNMQTDFSGVALICMAPQGEFTASVSYLTETVKVSGFVAEAALESVKVNLTFGLSFILVLSLSCVAATILIIFLMLKITKIRRVQTLGLGV